MEFAQLSYSCYVLTGSGTHHVKGNLLPHEEVVVFHVNQTLNLGVSESKCGRREHVGDCRVDLLVVR